MKRTVEVDPRPDYSNLIAAIQYLDKVLKQGVVIGIYEDSKEVSDEEIRDAIKRVNALLAETANGIEKAARALTRAMGTGSRVLQ